MMRVRSIAAVAALMVQAAPFQPAIAAGACSGAISVEDRLGALEDMASAAEAVPQNRSGPVYDWMRHGRPGKSNKPGHFRSIIPWSVVMEAPGNRLSRATVEVRDMQLFVFSKTSGQWREVGGSNGLVEGGYYARDAMHKLRSLPVAASGEGSVFRASSRYVTHFWPASGRQDIDPDDIGGVLVKVRARMDPADYAAGARYVMDAAADYWLDSRAAWDNMKTNGDAGIGRMKRLMPTWRTFYMTTADAATLERCIG